MAYLDFLLREASGVDILTGEFVLEMESQSADAFQIHRILFSSTVSSIFDPTLPLHQKS